MWQISSIQKFLFCDTNSMTRFCYSIHLSPNFYTPFICFRVSAFHIIYHICLFLLLSSSLSATIDTFWVVLFDLFLPLWKIQLQKIILCTFLYWFKTFYIVNLVLTSQKGDLPYEQEKHLSRTVRRTDRGYQRKPLRRYLRRCAPQRCGWLRLRYDKWNRGLSRGFLYEPFRNTLRWRSGTSSPDSGGVSGFLPF